MKGKEEKRRDRSGRKSKGGEKNEKKSKVIDAREGTVESGSRFVQTMSVFLE